MDENRAPQTQIEAGLKINSKGEANIELGDSFQLERHDFVDKSLRIDIFDEPQKKSQGIETVATPDQIPTAINRSHIPVEIQRSATIEAVFAQNEDHMARLKVTLRRLSQTESEIESIKSENRKLTQANRILEDRKSITTEKESAWKLEIQKLEDKMAALHTQAELVKPLTEKLERYKKYHEKVKTQVKPFVQQLKTYSENLTTEIQRLQMELNLKEQALEKDQRLRAALEEDLLVAIHRLESQRTLLVTEYERERDLLRTENTQLKSRVLELEDLASRVDKLRCREDELENLLVALRRENDSTQKSFREKQQDLLNQVGQLKAEVQHQALQLEDAKKLNAAQTGELTRVEHLNGQLTEQLTSLRFLWAQQNKELEKLRSSQSALESLNSELSQKLNQFRSAERLEFR